MLKSISSLDQKLGAPEKTRYTSALFHLRPDAAGDWCSWIAPSAWPNSWTTTRSYSSSSVSSRSQPKFIVGWYFGKYFSTRASVPTADQEPVSAEKEMRMCSSGVVTKSSEMFAYGSHSAAFS